MDVTFTNVLEGARQYFQGVPAATGSTASPSFSDQQHNRNNVPDQNHERANIPYWTPQQEQARTPSTERNSSDRPPENTGVPQGGYQGSYGEQQNQFHFSRPQSREAPSNVLQQQQYQSHILPNPAYQQQRGVSRAQDASTGANYYQMQSSSQAPQHNSSHSQSYDYTQSRSYYPVQQQQQQQQSYTAATSQGYKVSASQAGTTANDGTYYSKMYTSNSQGGQNANSYPAKPATDAYVNQNSNSQKTTHNLPPIAALSSVNYHSNRSPRDSLRLHAAKTRSVATTNASAAPTTSSAQYSHYNARVPSHYPDYNNLHYGQQTKVQATQPQQNQHQVAPSQTYTNTSTSYPNNQNYYQFPNKAAQEERRPQQQPVNSNPQPQQVYAQNPQRVPPPVAKQKRESPLDLSVKTVRTSADSTLDDVEDRLGKYGARNTQNQSHSYPTFNVYPNSFHRNLTEQRPQVQGASAPKVDFLPNFNVPTMNQPHTYNNKRPVQQQQQHYEKANRLPTTTAPQIPHRPINSSTNAHMHNYAPQTVPKKASESLPRIDFPVHGHKSSVMYPVPPQDVQRKRHGDPAPSFVPSKVPKVESWRQTIDQQIEQKLSSYTKRLQAQQPTHNTGVKTVVNGTYPSQEKPKETYMNSYHKTYNYQQQSYQNSNQYHQQHQQSHNHNQTYVPTVVAHHYPGSYNTHQQQPGYPQHVLNRTGANPPLANVNRNNSRGGADKHVLNLLRNSLEIKGAKEAQKKLEQEQYKMYESAQHSRPEVQQPSTDVTAPLQPKTILGRHNVSPFTASSLLERNSNTPPTYKFHFPKAIDSVRFDMEVQNSNTPITNHLDVGQNNADLDGLAAFLAARIRTKAELKQVGPTQNVSNASTTPNEASKPSPQISTSSSGGSPPKLVKEKQVYPPRRRLFSRNEDETGVIPSVPPRDKSGLRSSSETSVFDFPDTDSEGEMPVLERQSLEDMRRDRKSCTKTGGVVTLAELKVESPRPPSPLDDIFDQACDNIMEQLKINNGKKRGRRKKLEADVIAKLETVTKEKPLDEHVRIKVEPEELVMIKTEDGGKELLTPKVESDSDSDVPLIKCKTNSNQNTVEDPSELFIKNKKSGRRKLDSTSESSSDSETDLIKVTALKTECDQEIVSKSTSDITEKSILTLNKIGKPVRKPTFGDGTGFHPGWEEEVYKYKKSLRMPASLIQLTRPPNCHRLSTSLPDLDPCPNSPTPSSVTDNMEYSSKQKVKVKSELIDSDVDSNSSFSFSFSTKNYDSEGSSSVRSLNASPKDNNSILDRLLERYGRRKRRKYKKKDEQNGPKIIPKSENPLELLSTPSLEIDKLSKTNETKKRQPIVKLDSVVLGFRKKTINNFKDAFINNTKNLAGINEQFTTVVLKSRTRTETRVLKQRATIKEVFGEDRPASAPPITCIDNIKSEIEDVNENKPVLDTVTPLKDRQFNTGELLNTKQALKNKLLGRDKKSSSSLLKLLVNKKITDFPEEEENVHIKDDPDSKSETPSLDGDDSSTHSRKRGKLRNIRRKLSSGFDYIRKKKKQVKKEPSESEFPVKPKRRGGILPKSNPPESVQDIQKEIKMWVLNKGIGETHLHRAARLGYTDITAYCLEKMNCSPSPKDNAGYTPLHEACSRGHLPIAKLLLKYGASVSESAQGGIRPLHEAVENGFVEIVRLLLSYGADPLLATYSGLTPLSLAIDEATVALLQHHLADVQGDPSPPWCFLGPASCLDNEDVGYNPLEETPEADPDPESDDSDIDFEVSETPLPNLYTLRGETEKWVLLQDLTNVLKVKSRDALLKQLMSPTASTSSGVLNRNVVRELKMSDFLEQARCCQFLNGSEKVNTRASKVALVKYTDRVRQLLNVERVFISVR